MIQAKSRRGATPKANTTTGVAEKNGEHIGNLPVSEGADA